MAINALAKGRLKGYISLCLMKILQDLKAYWYGRKWAQNYLCQ